MRTPLRSVAVVAAIALAAAGCGGDGDGRATAAAPVATTSVPAPQATTTAATTPAPTTVAPTTTAAPTTPPPTPRPPVTVAAVRRVAEQPFVPFATVGGITLHHPAALVERVGFHEANHDGARQLEPLPTAVAPVTLESRQRGTSPRSAADVVVDPGTEIRSPVTGRVKRAGTYVLYCEHSDDYAVIAPDGAPSWEVKLLHIDGVRVRAGDRVVAGETVIAPRATQLPFESQVDEVSTVRPAWPHVHVEVVDPSIPDRPNPGGGGGC